MRALTDPLSTLRPSEFSHLCSSFLFHPLWDMHPQRWGLRGDQVVARDDKTANDLNGEACGRRWRMSSRQASSESSLDFGQFLSSWKSQIMPLQAPSAAPGECGEGLGVCHGEQGAAGRGEGRQDEAVHAQAAGQGRRTCCRLLPHGRRSV